VIYKVTGSQEVRWLRFAVHHWRKLEAEFQTQLHGTVTSRPEDGIGSRDVGSGAAATEAGTENRRIIHSKAILPTIRIRKIWMVEDIKELSAELGAESFTKLPILRYREVPVAESGVTEYIASHGAKSPQGRRNHRGVALGVAAEHAKRLL
jgi:hypothetical protein